MLDPHRAEIDAWLDVEPMIRAIDVLAKLKARHSDRLTDNPLKTTQRKVKAWRGGEAERVIRCGAAVLESVATTKIAAPTPPPWVRRDLPRVAPPEP